jgi:hypothetical protein
LARAIAACTPLKPGLVITPADTVPELPLELLEEEDEDEDVAVLSGCICWGVIGSKAASAAL